VYLVISYVVSFRIRRLVCCLSYRQHTEHTKRSAISKQV